MMEEFEFKQQPRLETERLILRPFAISDAAVVQQLAGAREVAATTLNIPHPYEDGMAEQWIGTHREEFENGGLVNFAIVVRKSNALCGCIGLSINRAHARAELGYWIGVPYWNNGYCTEAAEVVVGYAFETMKLHRIYSSHIGSNRASGRVMEKIGMQYEGCSREHTRKWNEYHDLMTYGILENEWERRE
jgi:RimJ/RimL family protein N-acetyltransferase